MKIHVTGIGWVNARGMGRGGDLSAFRPRSGPLPLIERKALFDRGFNHFGRLDAFSRTGLAGIAYALKDAGLEAWRVKRNIGMAIASEWGCLGTDVNYHHSVVDADSPSPSPALFSYTLPNSFLGEAAVYYGLTGPSCTLTDPAPNRLLSVQMGIDLLLSGQADGMLAGGCDIALPPELPLPDDVTPGCTIVVLEKSGTHGGRVYGRLEKTPGNEMMLNDRPVAGLAELVHRCVKSGGHSN